jgi:hypothetical protein
LSVKLAIWTPKSKNGTATGLDHGGARGPTGSTGTPSGLLLVLLMAGCAGAPEADQPEREPAGRRTEPEPVPAEAPAARGYVASRAREAPRIDGRLDEAAWDDVAWTEPFLDIEGERRPAPRFETRVRMMWDETRLYIGAVLEEPHLQASLEKRDTVLYLDNDFEVFIDPDGDTHDYFELEVNALGTEWDLRLGKPYRDGGRADHAWDIAGLRTAVSLDGTLNDPSDRDRGWSVEIAIPFAALGLEAPRDGEQWRLNFSRVEWAFDVAGGGYRKKLDAASGRPLPEDNWVWSPQYAVNMHMPELWGVVQFSALPPGIGVGIAPLEDARECWSLRRLYYSQRAFRREHGRWAARLDELVLPGLDPGLQLMPARERRAAPPGEAWSASLQGASGAVWRIRADGRVWKD